MGTTFSTIQIMNSKKISPEQFKESLCKYFAKKGLVIATEDEAQFSYRIAFSDKSNWVTLSLPEYESNMQLVQEDAQGIAKTLKTYCISTSVWDSDMLCLDLFSSEKQRDSVIAGRPLDDDFPGPKGNQKLWQPLLEENATWEQLSEIFSGDYTFIEDALVEMAPLLGMDSENIARGYDNDNPGSVDLYLKKAQQAGKKAISLNAAFKQIYGEALEPLGFVRIKSKYPYFVRLIGDEIIHVITFDAKESSDSHLGFKGFSVMGGVATVYRKEINLTQRTRLNYNWLSTVGEFYSKLNPEKHGDSVWKSLYCFSYKNDNVDTMLSEVKRSLEAAKQFMLPVFDKVNDLEACVEYFRTFSSPMQIYDDEDFGIKYSEGHCTEGLLLIKTNNRDDGVARIERTIAEISQQMKEGVMGGTQKDFEEMCKKVRSGGLKQITLRDKILNDPELYAKVLSELERRKAANIVLLRSYGLDS